jgi:hypothetical protein
MLIFKVPQEKKYLIADPDMPSFAFEDLRGKPVAYMGRIDGEGISLESVTKRFNSEAKSWEVGDGLAKHPSGYATLNGSQVEELFSEQKKVLTARLENSKREFFNAARTIAELKKQESEFIKYDQGKTA